LHYIVNVYIQLVLLFHGTILLQIASKNKYTVSMFLLLMSELRTILCLKWPCVSCWPILQSLHMACILITAPSKLAQVVTLVTCIRKGPYLNFDQDT